MYYDDLHIRSSLTGALAASKIAWAPSSLALEALTTLTFLVSFSKSNTENFTYTKTTSKVINTR